MLTFPPRVLPIGSAYAIWVDRTRRGSCDRPNGRGECRRGRVMSRRMSSANGLCRVIVRTAPVAWRSCSTRIVLNPFWIRQKTGTTHGTPYPYDSRIPLIFMGNGIRDGRYARHVALNDVAPTLATRFGVSVPSGSIGKVLSAVLGPAPAASDR